MFSLMLAPGGNLRAQDLPAMPPQARQAGTYPKLANYYLKYFNEGEYDTLAKWDLLILPPEMTLHNKSFFDKFRQQKKEGLLLSYVYPAMINESGVNESTGLHGYLYEEVEKNNWWLRDGSGQKVEVWPSIYAVNLNNKDWIEFNADYVNGKINIGEWDGIMYDTVNSSIDNGNSKGVDIDCDGVKDDKNYANQKWREGMAELFKKTREKIGSKAIIINGDSLDLYQPNVNGRMFETFPTPWEGNGTWSATMSQYLEGLPKKNAAPQIYIINANTKNTGKMDSYREMRFGLTSALLGDGYFSFDYGDQSHAQTWWYDEYDVNLGKVKSVAYNLFDRNDGSVKSGLWRRDFDFGMAIVNATNEAQKYVFSKEEFEKINGKQDKTVNDGSKTNWIKLSPNDGVVLLKINTEIRDNSFNNGDFTRVFNKKGEQAHNGFFAYKDSFVGAAQILASDIDNDGDLEMLISGRGAVAVYDNEKKINAFSPYGASFKKEISLAIADFNNDGIKEIITVPLSGGPHVKIFRKDGKILGQFFAYDQNFRGGVNVAAGDLNGDGREEIITAPASKGGPFVKVFSAKGKLLIPGFFAYDQNFRGGVNVAAGDLNGDGREEIITGAGAGGGPQIRIFNKDGKATGQFFAYDKNMRSGVKVMADDMDNDKTSEILASTTNF